ncbi:hypothetical protein I7I50_05710 [Histoplasma capsulatum G186AR]|uniref:Gag protein n=1 Tax=Ajellomyces capsulatus TaxID=5037 RepID=A0A8H8D7Y4_AJECA|nr:hypothetical protein I7I52_03970 [Histoplasma capsulatum]QSS76306.1 hypothetical protein I7I50_05710 [Histoplasma capsulatum G186AR]
MPVSTRATNREETPENQITPGTFPTPVTTRRPRYQAPEREEMADQDEAAVLRHRIAQLDDELRQMRAASTPATAAAQDGNELSPDLAAHLRDQGDTPALSRVLQEFRERVKYLQKPGLLKSASDYPIWKEEILLAIKQSHTEDILTTKPLENASKDMKRYWEERNSWLYNLIWSSVSVEAKSLFTIPQDSLDSSALWKVIEASFSERVEIRRVRLSKEFNDITAATYGGSSRSFIERLLAIRVEYIRLGYDVPNFILFDKLLNGLTKGWSSFVKDRMDHAAKDDNNVRPFEDNFLGLCNDILLRLPLDDKNVNAATGYMKDKNIKDKSTKECNYCDRKGHDETHCWDKYPEKKPKNLQQKASTVEPVNVIEEQVF